MTQLLSYQKRVVLECEGLVARAGALKQFLEDDLKGVGSAERGRLIEQLAVMDQYADILKRRIEGFNHGA